MNQAQVQELGAIYALLDDDAPQINVIRARVRGLLDSVLWMRNSGASITEPLTPVGEVFGANPKQVVRFIAKTERKTHSVMLILPASCALKKGQNPLLVPLTKALREAIEEHLGTPYVRVGYFNIVYTDGK